MRARHIKSTHLSLKNAHSNKTSASEQLDNVSVTEIHRKSACKEKPGVFFLRISHEKAVLKEA